jgi:hypothetical protein
MALPLWFSEIVQKYEHEAYKIGLTPDEFWGMIPSDFFKLYQARMEALIEQEERENFRNARLLTLMHNINSKKKRKVEDFMPKKKKVMSADEMYRTVKGLNAMLGGTKK